jgi:uncharacterized protein (UPF0333 family)
MHMKKEHSPKQLKNKNPSKALLPLIILLIIAAAIFLLVKNMGGPAKGSVSTASPTAANIQAGQTGPAKYDDKYLSFTYPGGYKIVTSQKTGSFLDVVALTNSDHSNRYAAIGVVKESLDNDPGINYRVGHPDTYKQVSKTSDRVVFKSTQSSAEQTGFIAHNGLVVSISLTATSEKDLSKDYDTISNSLQWK